MECENKTCLVVDWGLEPYGRILALQQELVSARKAGRISDVLLLGEHTPVITLGRNARRENLLLPEDELKRRGVDLHETDRGGDVTYHGPGQLVGYPILDLAGLRKDVVWYVRSLEEVLIRAARSFDLAAERRTAPESQKQLYTGVWVGEEKLAAIGVHLSRWVTSHGFAFNVTTNLSHFDFIVPCGIRDKGVTSLEKQVPRLRDDNRGALIREFKAAAVAAFGGVFNREMHATDLEALEGTLAAQQAAAS